MKHNFLPYKKSLNRSKLKSHLLTLLAQDPLWTNELAACISLDNINTARLLSELRNTGKIERIQKARKGSFWRLADAPRLAPSEKTEVLDEEHQAWMAYWQTPRAERRRMENPL